MQEINQGAKNSFTAPISRNFALYWPRKIHRRSNPSRKVPLRVFPIQPERVQYRVFETQNLGFRIDLAHLSHILFLNPRPPPIFRFRCVWLFSGIYTSSTAIQQVFWEVVWRAVLWFHIRFSHQREVFVGAKSRLFAAWFFYP